MLEITVGGNSIKIPAFITPGQNQKSISLELGYGRKFDGRIGNGVGFNVYPLRTSTSSCFMLNGTIKVLNETYPLASTQDHHGLEDDKYAAPGFDNLSSQETQSRIPELVKQSTLEYYQDNPDWVQKKVGLSPVSDRDLVGRCFGHAQRFVHWLRFPFCALQGDMGRRGSGVRIPVGKHGGAVSFCLGGGAVDHVPPREKSLQHSSFRSVTKPVKNNDRTGGIDRRANAVVFCRKSANARRNPSQTAAFCHFCSVFYWPIV